MVGQLGMYRFHGCGTNSVYFNQEKNEKFNYRTIKYQKKLNSVNLIEAIHKRHNIKK